MQRSMWMIQICDRFQQCRVTIARSKPFALLQLKLARSVMAISITKGRITCLRIWDFFAIRSARVLCRGTPFRNRTRTRGIWHRRAAARCSLPKTLMGKWNCRLSVDFDIFCSTASQAGRSARRPVTGSTATASRINAALGEESRCSAFMLVRGNFARLRLSCCLRHSRQSSRSPCWRAPAGVTVAFNGSWLSITSAMARRLVPLISGLRLTVRARGCGQTASALEMNADSVASRTAGAQRCAGGVAKSAV